MSARPAPTSPRSPRSPVAQRPSPVARVPRPSRESRPDPDVVARQWAAELAVVRPGLVAFVLDRLAEVHGRPAWEPRLDPVSELILTILTQNSADINAEVAFAALRAAYPPAPAGLGRRGSRADPGADRRHPPRRLGQPESPAHPGCA